MNKIDDLMERMERVKPAQDEPPDGLSARYGPNICEVVL